ncbi:ABC transporter substrate-binding protein [Butyrivibrio sp. YAB3001]|uniref:ABC transporter substrate-binding protein n=1 Tax=Butyrivibrio sp. YAB3001 TaxID=1520812 RepID=UPI0008F66831|nr:ABC transporter substrate-binding protein [Butyrivibrio sp. YAB3001]SFC54809.1 iron complex transport system substrate-binding protein [Butyrivibrio sp. YAB3001]
MVKELRKRGNIIKYFIFVFFSVLMIGCGNISDGEFTASVVLTGGSGKAYIESPCKVTVSDGKAIAHIVWSSPNYDFMILDGETYYPVNEEGNSKFDIPVQFDKEMVIQADTTAMSTPHLIEYTLLITLDENSKEALNSDGNRTNSEEITKTVSFEPPIIDGYAYLGTDENEYAEGFRIHRYEGDYAVISMSDGRNYLIVPEGSEAPDKIADDIIILQRPLDRIYLAASGVMCHFDSLGRVDDILFSGLDTDDWYIESAIEAMESGRLLYGGKYSAPDYEQMVNMGVDVAIENTMILHVPKVQEKLEQLGIPVFVDRSSYEPQPLGRCEWIKVYGVLTGCEEKAKSAFDEQKAQVNFDSLYNLSEKKVVIFSLNSNHQVVTKKANDYFAKMVEMAGGKYLSPQDGDEEGTAQTTISMEAFYSYASDADILIYNATISDVPKSLEELENADAIFSDFKAFSEGCVWYTDKSLYQFADRTGTIINNLQSVITEGTEETVFFHKLK